MQFFIQQTCGSLVEIYSEIAHNKLSPECLMLFRTVMNVKGKLYRDCPFTVNLTRDRHNTIILLQ